MSTILLNSAADLSGSDIKTVALFLRPERLFGVVVTVKKRYDSLLCAVFGFVVVCATGLFSSFLRTESSVGVAIWT